MNKNTLKIRIFKQKYPSTCLIACLKSLFLYLNPDFNPESIDEKPTEFGYSFFDGVEIAKNNGFSLTGVIIGRPEMAKSPYITEIIVNNCHHVVILISYGDKIVYGDPIDGKIHTETAKHFKNHWTKYALVPNSILSV